MKKFIPFIMGVLMVIFEWKVSNSFHMLCSLYSDVEDIFVHLFHCVLLRVCNLGLRERDSIACNYPFGKGSVFCKGALIGVQIICVVCSHGSVTYRIRGSRLVDH